MLRRLKESFEAGVEKIKWFSSLLSERLKIEISIVRLIYQSGQMEKKRDSLMKTIGERLYDMKEHPEAQIMKDKIVVDAMREIEEINAEIESTRKKASEISRMEE